MLAIYAPVCQWRSLLAGIHFEAHTDHQNLVFFQKLKALSERTLTPDQDITKDISDDRLQSRIHQALTPKDGYLVVTAAIWATAPDRDPEGTTTKEHPTLPSPFINVDLTNLWNSALQRNERYWEVKSAIE
ncbi:hypothetical protein Cpir12675_006491 [Ceratocystis pirilliformis]|uniref:Reverse transcriptase RNase H-like domain-containing protein n=1 Tax=Ceratocystis pirilliformis TaxID=259994 RepID=A0ABR3YGY4_9PEZI